MSTAEIVLEYAKLILAAPAMFAFTAIAFFAIFRKSLSALIARIGSIKFPGGGEVTTQLEKTEDTLNSSTSPPEPLPATTQLPAIPDNTAGVDQNALISDLQARLRAQREAAYLWEYRYLNPDPAIVA